MEEFNSEKKFIKDFIIQEIENLLTDGHTRAAFVMMSQTIEVFGSFLDNKPFKAKAQSKIRFRNAIYQLFPPRYTKFNKGDRLYNQFRSALTHMFIPSSHLHLTKTDDKHLILEEGKLIISAPILLKDIKRAGNTILKRLEKGELKHKNMDYSWLD